MIRDIHISRRRAGLAAAAAAVAIIAAIFAAGQANAADADRLIILGFDGMDPNLVEQYMGQGYLPNLKALAERGSYRRLDTTNPAQSPVAWSCFSIGANPAYTNIFDFLNRIPGTYYPEFAMTKPGSQEVPVGKVRFGAVALSVILGLIIGRLIGGRRKTAGRRIITTMVAFVITALILSAISLVFVEAWVPDSLPKPICGRQGTPFWVATARAGIPTVALQMPAAFPAEDMGPNGRMTAGLGVPDLRQTNGTFSLYSTERFEAVDTEMGGKLITVTMRDNSFSAPIYGPKDPTSPLERKPDLTVKLEGKIDPAFDKATIEIQGQKFELEPGQWSDWVEVVFSPNPLIRIHGIARMCLLEVRPTFRLYLSPINFDPRVMPFTVEYSYPRSFGEDLAKEIGLYKTLGWAIDTWSLNEERVTEKQFMEDLFFTFERRRAIFWNQFDKADWRLLIFPFMETDRVNHMFWRFVDPSYPMYDEKLAAEYGDSILKVYVEVDKFAGEVVSRMGDNTTLLVLSDHGFHPFNKAVNINTWLVRNGYMTLVSDDSVRDRNLEDLFGQGEFWPNVDWSRTRAYALGLGMIFLNMAGREPQGIVRQDEYEGLQAEIVQGLGGLLDPVTGERVVRNVYTRQEVYKGPYYDAAPDLLVGFMPGYRVSWQTALGGIPRDIIEPNMKKWSGDHCSFDPPITQGVFFSSTPIDYDSVRIYDFAPTTLRFFNLEIPEYMEGRPLLAGRK